MKRYIPGAHREIVITAIMLVSGLVAGAPSYAMADSDMTSYGLLFDSADTNTYDGNDPSLANESTFFLFRDAQDFLQSPGRLSMLERNSASLQLEHSQLSPDASLSLNQRLGPGQLSFHLRSSLNASGSGSTHVASTDPVSEHSSSQESSATEHLSSLNVLAGYGLPLGPVRVGLTARLLTLKNSYEGGQTTVTAGDTSATESQAFSGIVQLNRAQVTAGISFGKPDGFFLEGDVYVGRQMEPFDYSSTWFSSDGATNSTAGQSIDADRISMTSGLLLNSELAFNRHLGLEVLASVERNSGDYQATTESQNGSDAVSGYTYSQIETVTTSSASTKVSALAAVRAKVSGDLELRAGAGYRSTMGGWEGQSISMYLDPSGTTTTVIDDEGSFTGGVLFVPVALALRASPQVSVRLGAQYLRETSVVEQAINESWQEQNSSANSRFEYGVGLEFKPSDKVQVGVLLQSQSGKSIIHGEPFPYILPTVGASLAYAW